jgi:signal transduction histidine kinase
MKNLNFINIFKILFPSFYKINAAIVHSEKMSSLGRLFAQIAHEINNPINFISSNIAPLKNYISGLLSLIKQYEKEFENKESEEIRKIKREIDFDFIKKDLNNLILNIEEGTNRTLSIIKDIKSCTRFPESEIKSINIIECIESTLNIIRNLYKGRISIHKDYEEILFIECYASELNQVFMNILTNACNAITNNGDIWIVVKKNKDNVSISIKDNGIGIDPKIKEKIFEPFFTTKDIKEGTGLGLAICNEIIKKHKGKILVTSEINKGSEFTIVLPIKLKRS